jgi:endonuclease IV
MGYHINKIEKGENGEFSKIKEEYQELTDAIQQEVKILELIELSDLYGAIESYIQKHHNIDMMDLKQMSDLTKRAFNDGTRTPRN